ncbi:Copper amine oxidase N-terminal domain-containing protein [Peptoniphilus asaccharolyticus DSM 20463]|uniref:Copper amine oxidase N-terminal domain-containing protein n=1 Tax=Peptoniphilus asaccharolyticus DSM 20463 TaxID=573058 RepID=A0A1W1UXW3_PEPAS|nr:copper amine oxidase N-terminal domain-containing protein [Peptoniphilus asaccharolyticus]MBL7575330.1 copper amine oxidase N-terminal domain-containing protein [Peptoniphilus asaccharolyticus]SMB85958.1 Copper amine oxidase N-terminal domain-containing protein [Peptoniphilus asaccharolyticus DSM 20463]
MKKFITICICILSMSSICLASGRELKISALGNTIDSSKGVFLDTDSSKVMAPVRDLVKNLGANVEYLPATEDRTAGFVVTYNDISIGMFENSSRAYLMKNSNTKSVDIGIKVVNINSKNYVPVRFIAENLGYQVEWKNLDSHDLVEITQVN